ncbi:UvrD-helicase domain-containing protein [Acinetobacter guillouiae]|uniref:UvrD-helicase domain-containing protein n=1 Tax=Acinetobacter guillouiae TaxID=106649 RepID=UPI0004EF5CCF|nr:UvrD-helicase domain-containing protein [Acinetobacter guillouiae]MBP2545715.1 exodeoxyribonuclease V beta subunit [Acinetobacter guillouiae]BAP38938.1 exodeoxyribonuclease V beta chain [Acinetobacter guillouiae]
MTSVNSQLPAAQNGTAKKVSIQPIEDMQFSGLHWIEASAGTGKTYTLSSLMVRIFLEKYLPSQVIATTFTRKAAAELKTRIRLRLQETYRYFDSCRELTEAQVLTKAAQESDPLFSKVLKMFASRIAYACERLKLVIDQLDELFVGTLDSFSQKLLREFAFESGKIERAEITDDAKSYSQQLIHDVLRAWIQKQPQDIVDSLMFAGELHGVDYYVATVEQSLNFASANFIEPKFSNADVQLFQQAIEQLAKIQLDQLQTLQSYYLLDGEFYKFANGTKFRNDRLNRIFAKSLPRIIQTLQQHDYKHYLSSKLSVEKSDFATLIKVIREQQIFKKAAPENVQSDFYQHTLIQQLLSIYAQIEIYENQLLGTNTFLKYYLAKEVKTRLPQVLQQKGETTFAQQIRTLAEALQGEQGQRFATFVHARYPLILVDEFQDTNQDQDDMLAQIWRHPNRVKQGCMIMVGDRKQAIYGFRGGDMLTFLKAHQDVFGKAGHEYNLIFNHRSVKPLVEVVDALFQRQMDFGEQVWYTPVQAGPRPHPDLLDQGHVNPQPLRWIKLEDKNQEAEQVAWKIRELLNQGIQGSLYFIEKSVHRAVDENDIAILSKNHDGLDKAQSALEFLGIRTSRPSKKSVFESQIAGDVGAVLAAILHPYHEAKVKRALLSRLIGFDLKALIVLEQHADGLSVYIELFDQIREMWLNQGFLTAWQYLLNQFSVWTKLVEKHSRDNERVVVNLRHLTELLSQHSEDYQGAQNLYHWYLKQLTSPMEREWEMERKLSNEAGVQLMTIHQSKGLEFKFVFLLGADKDFKEINKTLNFSTVEQLNVRTGQNEQQRVVAINDANLLDKKDIEQHNERALAEHHRLWYVALTRASYRVYAMLSDVKEKSTTGLAFWRGQGANTFQHAGTAMQALLTERPPRLEKPKSEVQLPLLAQAFPTQRFYPRGKTSFSALAQHLTRQQIQDALAVSEQKQDRAEDEIQQPIVEIITDVVPSQPLAWIKANFPMGTIAGNFLHEIFEHIDFKDTHYWRLEIRRRFKNDYSSLWTELLEKYQQAFLNDNSSEDVSQTEHAVEETLIDWMAKWLQDVLSTPILSHFKMGQLEPHEHLAEFPFYLALSDRVLAIKRIHQLFDEHAIAMPEFKDANSARYLNGSIDLVFFDGQQYHIADYKSNFLGVDQQSYSFEAVQDSMSHASYWLQASLYLVALHRYLKIQLEDYQIDRDLGGATYLYLRGMNGQSGQGYYFWRPTTEFILRLDAILGYFTEDKPS